MNWLDMSSEFTQRDAENVTEAQENLRKLGERQAEAQQLNPGRFPAHYFAKKKDEERVRLIQNYVKFLNSPGQLSDETKGGVAALYTPTEDDIRVIERKDQEKRLVNFEGFLEHFFDLKNPIHQKLLNDVYPQYYDRRLEIINDNLKLQEKMARLKLYGPQTQEDIFFLYALWQGDIEIPDTLANSLDTKVFDDEKYRRGMFNVKRWAGRSPKVTASPMGAANLFTDERKHLAAGPFDQTKPRTFAGYLKAAPQMDTPDTFGGRASYDKLATGQAFVASIFSNTPVPFT
jgi:hypothetical protein